ncbi:MAG: chromosomal replication initiator protein DnaA [Deltaproteobacteria bacterium]|nr:chromosomal replication initiator protein DnaA [Deltaproteobacteria bacterium]
MTDIWTEALRGLQPRLGRETYDLWLRPLELVTATETRVQLRAPSQFMKEWFENHYKAAVLDEMTTRGHAPPAIEIEVAIEMTPEAEPAAVPAPAAPSVAVSAPIPVPPVRAPPPTGLANRYRFDTFITGASNELAASAAAAVAEEPGQRFNPLLLYGGVGLGKTHLLHAVGHAIHDAHPEKRIVYLSAERFMNEFISAVRYNQFDEFRQRYREESDVLLVDDIQFIAGRDRTMDEFFHVFNALYEAGKQIMVTADRTPSDMQGMEERLTSRLNWGLVADVKAPDLETRVAILRQKAEQDRIGIPDDVCVHLATLVRSNVRELEGALVRVSTFAALKGRPITEAFVREVLGEAAEAERHAAPITVEAVQKTVAQYFSVRISDLKGPRRHKGIARPRMIAMFLSRELTGSSFPEIGMRFGGKDHSTVINACKRMTAISLEDPELRATISSLRTQLVAPSR